MGVLATMGADGKKTLFGLYLPAVLMGAWGLVFLWRAPVAGEMGGVASGTELYYAYNYGTVHIVSLDSQLATKDDAKREAMKTWL